MLLRVVGTGGSLATNWGCTVRCGVAVVVGLAAVEVPVVLVVLVAAGLGAVAYAAKMRDEEKLRCCIRLAIDGVLDDEAEIRAETPLRAGAAAIVTCKGGWG